MKAEEIIELFQQFESIANEYEGVECWNSLPYWVMPNGVTSRIS